MTNEDIVKSNKRWFLGVSLSCAIAGIILFVFGFEYPANMKQALFLSMLTFWTSGLYMGTYVMYSK